MAHPVLKIHLNGRFRIIGTDGREVRLASAKAQGVVALLATESHLTRQRLWIQDELWSSSEAEKGANSLRQVLFQIRKALGENANVLEADRTTVRLSADRVRVVEAEEGEFLEGIDVGDPEFES